MQLTLHSNQIWIGREAVDFRKAIDGLCSVVIEQFGHNPQQGIYIFYNRGRDKIKVLGWHRNGFVLIYKRLEHGRFHIVKQSDDVVMLDAKQLSWLLAGLDWPLMSNWEELNYDDYT